jgi:hypothetical protein
LLLCAACYCHPARPGAVCYCMLYASLPPKPHTTHPGYCVTLCHGLACTSVWQAAGQQAAAASNTANITHHHAHVGPCKAAHLFQPQPWWLLKYLSVSSLMRLRISRFHRCAAVTCVLLPVALLPLAGTSAAADAPPTAASETVGAGEAAAASSSRLRLECRVLLGRCTLSLSGRRQLLVW